MPDPHIRAAFYLSPTLDQWWRWTDDAQVLTWPDERTIAFGPEVEAVLGRLAAGGLPPFGAVALVLAACREGWADSPGRATVAGYAKSLGGLGVAADGGGGLPKRRATSAGVGGKGLKLVFGRVAQQVGQLLDGLDAVGRLPRELRTTPEVKAVLAETVFEAAANRGTPADAALVLEAMASGLSAETLRPQLRNEEALAQFARQVDGLADGLARVDAGVLARRLRTGLDEPVRPAEPDDVSPPERVRRLLAELRSDAELSGLARLAQDLLSAVTVPRSLKARDELELAGVSDLTHRGPLDRLLLSELAHDDLTLAVRVAVNEALYLRRESPAKEPPHRRAILLDAGVRTWGVPRVFAAAVALALSATGDPAGELRAFRATADGGVVPVDLTTRAGLDEHLAALETTAHPGASLVAFLAAAAQADAADGGDGKPKPEADAVVPTDAFVVTHADAAADRAFVAAARQPGVPTLYVASVDRDGSFLLTARTAAGQKAIRQAKLSFDGLFSHPLGALPSQAARLAGVPLIAPEGRRDDLPAIFFADPFPLRLPHAADPKRSAASKRHGLVTATDDGRLLHWADKDHGARQLTSHLPRGLLRLLQIDDESATARALVIRGKEMTAQLVLADLNEGGCAAVAVELVRPSPTDVIAWAGSAFLLYPGHVDAYGLADGRHLATLDLPAGAKWHRERFFRLEGQFFALACDGTPRLTLERVPAPALAHVLFDRVGHDGPWALTGDARTLDPSGNVHDLPDTSVVGGDLLGTSADGGRLAVRDRTTPSVAHLVDLTGPARVTLIQGDWREALLAPQIHWSTRCTVSLRKRVAGIGVDANGRLALAVGPKTAVPIEVDADGRLVLGPVAHGSKLLALQPLQDVPRSTAARLKLHVATWPDGSRAWLDGRGLLHLKSADPAVAEVSIVLRSDRGPTPAGVAAWSSDGKLCGPAFFVGDAVPTPAGHFTDLLTRFRKRLR